MFEQQISKFFSGVDNTHANNLHQGLDSVLPLIKHYPELAAREIHRFRKYFITAPTHNRMPALKIVYRLAEAVPILREQIIKDMGDVFYELLPILEDLPEGEILNELLSVLKLPILENDKYLQELSRAIVTLKESMICVIGAGFSYDVMPITYELQGLLAGILSGVGISDPVNLLKNDEKEAWRIIKEHKQEFKQRFAGWCDHSKPTDQHENITNLFHVGQISHIISFNWDNLCERAYYEQFKTSIGKIVKDGMESIEPTLWKLHGDVEDISSEWVFPYDEGVVFDSLLYSLERSIRERRINHAVIVGYSEFESVVKEKLITWLENNIPIVFRIRPDWTNGEEGGLCDTAKHFFQKLKIYMEIESRR